MPVPYGKDAISPCWQVVLAVGILHVCQEFGPFVCQRHPAPEQVAGGPHLGGIDIRLWAHATTEQDGDFVGIARVVFGLPAMDGLHREGMTEDERDACIGAEVGEPVPGEQTFDRHDGPFSIRGNGFQKGLWVRLHVAVQHDLAALVEDADIHGPRVQVDAAVKWVLSSVKSP